MIIWMTLLPSIHKVSFLQLIKVFFCTYLRCLGVRIRLGPWVRIVIQIPNYDPDPESPKWAIKKENVKCSCLKEFDVSFGELQEFFEANRSSFFIVLFTISKNLGLDLDSEKSWYGIRFVRFVFVLILTIRLDYGKKFIVLQVSYNEVLPGVRWVFNFIKSEKGTGMVFSQVLLTYFLFFIRGCGTGSGPALFLEAGSGNA